MHGSGRARLVPDALCAVAASGAAEGHGLDGLEDQQRGLTDVEQHNLRLPPASVIKRRDSHIDGFVLRAGR